MLIQAMLLKLVIRGYEKQIQIAIDGPAPVEVHGCKNKQKIWVGGTLDIAMHAATYLALQHQLTAADTEDIIRLLDDLSLFRFESGQQLLAGMMTIRLAMMRYY